MQKPHAATKPHGLKYEFERVCRLKHYSPATEREYWGWFRRFYDFQANRPPREMGMVEIRNFLSHLAVEGRVSSSTQNQALCALRFVYIEVLGVKIDFITGIEWAKRTRRIPVWFTKDEAERVIDLLTGTQRAIAGLLYGSGLRLAEAISLRVKDIDFEQGEVVVRCGKGDKDRRTVLPRSLYEELQAQLRRARIIWEADLRAGFGTVQLPNALARKYPAAPREWEWQWVFPAAHISTDKRTGFRGRWHIFPDSVQRAVKKAVARAGIVKRASPHTFRHSFATQLLESGYDIRTIQELMGHNSVQTTQIYTHVLNKGGRGVVSPLDRRTA